MADAIMQGVQPVYEVNKGNNDAFGGGGGSWIWFLLILLLMGGGNAFGGGVAANNATNMLNNDFLYTQEKIDRNTQQTTEGFNAVQSALCNGFSNVIAGQNQNKSDILMTVNNLGSNMQMGFCDINRNIDQVRFENAQNTCAITNAVNVGIQRVVDVVTQNEIQSLRDRLLESQSALNNQNQTIQLLNRLQPAAVPAYPAAAPFNYQANAHGGHCCNGFA